MSITFQSLESAAADVIAILKTIPECAEAHIAIIGGLALLKYLPTYRTTMDVNFVITTVGAPASVKQKLLRLKNSLFQQQAQFFYYNAPTGVKVQIDFCPGWQTPYLPLAEQGLFLIQLGSSLPYISATDLVVFKIYSCSLRAERIKRVRDAEDAKLLLQTLTTQRPLNLSAEQKRAVLDGLEAVISLTEDEAWWRTSLGV